MANVYGNLARRKPAGKPDVFMGELNVPQGIAGKIALIPIPQRGDNSPAFDVKIQSSGDWATLGKAWIKPFKNSDGEFFTMTIDSPMMNAPINLTAFPMDAEQQPKEWEDGDEPIYYEIVWQRPRKAASSAKASTASSGDDLDDDIPF